MAFLFNERSGSAMIADNLLCQLIATLFQTIGRQGMER